MKHAQNNKGMGLPAIIIVLGLILLGGIGYSVMRKPMGNEMEKKDSTTDEKMMMEKKAMEEKTMMEKDAMMKKDEMMMDHGTGTMMKEDKIPAGGTMEGMKKDTMVKP